MTNKEGQYECANCKLPYSNMTVGHWALDTYNLFKRRNNGEVFDVNYVYDGHVVAVQPFSLEGNKFVPMHMFISASCPRQLDKHVRENWRKIEQTLKQVKL